jgi:capsid protein
VTILGANGQPLEIKTSSPPSMPVRKTPGWNRQVRARYDAAQTTNDNRRHWAMADYLSADAAASPDVRRILRSRARYEIANNSYGKGILLTLANDTIGTGPRLQMLTEYEDLNREVELEFMMWSNAVRLPEKLRTMRLARCQDGEAFAIMAYNPRVMHEVKLDLMLIEADQVTSGKYLSFDDNEVDGITFDAFGNPDSYRVLKQHPGGNNMNYNSSAVSIAAEAMLHIFRMDRPGQHRGVPEITPALPLFAQLRRYTQAVLANAESCANFSGVLYTDAPANGEADEVDPMAMIELERNMLMTMPGGWKMGQLDPKQPSTTYAEFVRQIIDELVRCIQMPSNLGRGNSDNSSFASGRLDIQGYLRMLRVDQSFIATVIMDRILCEWLREFFLLHPPLDIRTRYPLPQHNWFWDASHYYIDPYKENRGLELSLKCHATTLAAVYANQGKDWESELYQLAREKKLKKKLGLTDDDVIPTQHNPDEREEEDDDDDE